MHVGADVEREAAAAVAAAEETIEERKAAIDRSSLLAHCIGSHYVNSRYIGSHYSLLTIP